MFNLYFTMQSIDKTELFDIKLWDRDKLNGMIENKE